MTYSKLMTWESQIPMNYSPERVKIDRIYLHHWAGNNLDAALNTWRAGGPANSSAHYAVTETEIIGAVPEEYAAWHAGNWGENLRSIGIEHKDLTLAPNWTIDPRTEELSARLVADICGRYSIPIDREHIRKHSEASATACPGSLRIDWIVARAQQIAAHGVNSTPPSAPAPTPVPSTPAQSKTAIQTFKDAGNVFSAFNLYQADKVKFHNGIWQLIIKDNVDDFDDGGIPLAIVTRYQPNGQIHPDQGSFNDGDFFKFDSGYNTGTIDQYDETYNACGIIYGAYGMIWHNADWLLKA